MFKKLYIYVGKYLGTSSLIIDFLKEAEKNNDILYDEN